LTPANFQRLDENPPSGTGQMTLRRKVMKTVEMVDRSTMISQMKAMLEIDPARTAIVAVDMHRGHLDPEVATMPCSREDSERVVREALILLGFARAHKIPVIHVVLVYRNIPGMGSEANARPFFQCVSRIKDETNRSTPGRKALMMEHNIEGSVQTQIIPQLYEKGDFIINNKKRQDCFMGTDLEILLHTLHVDTTVIIGINTNTCVLSTAYTANNKDYKVIVVSDCVASMYGEDLHLFALQNISRCLGWVLTLEEFKDKVMAASTGTKPHQ
jgi:biuret amidohydrolase